MSNTLVQPMKTKRLQSPLLNLIITDTTFNPGDMKLSHCLPPPQLPGLVGVGLAPLLAL